MTTKYQKWNTSATNDWSIQIPKYDYLILKPTSGDLKCCINRTPNFQGKINRISQRNLECGSVSFYIILVFPSFVPMTWHPFCSLDYSHSALYLHLSFCTNAKWTNIWFNSTLVFTYKCSERWVLILLHKISALQWSCSLSTGHRVVIRLTVISTHWLLLPS